MDAREVINRLQQEGGLSEVSQVFFFEGYRKTKGGDLQEVTVKILDAGPGESERYTCEAASEDGKVARGNPAGTIDEALAITHWYKLD